MTAKRVNIYVHDVDAFRVLQSEIRTMWFEKYGRYLSNSDVFQTALLYLKESLEEKHDNPRQDLYRYLRTGLSGK